MKKLIVCSSAVALATLLSGCVGVLPGVGATAGGIYSDVSGAMAATSNTGASKKGESTSTAILGFASGDSSIQTACTAGGITKIHHVDYHVTSVLGVYAKTVTTVYGE